LDARAGLRLSGSDVYLNVAGGLRVNEPAADLAVAAALTSAATETPTSAGVVYFGEVGLSGEIRQIAQAEARLKEAQKLGFSRACLPRRLSGRKLIAPDGLAIDEIGHLTDLVSAFSGKSGRE
ncbi:MAG: DNA repair protein RadA, partial [Pseudomonadota bacterium]|nr:DNA repair protein RadA [Pseudomonadota bacterium]